MIVNESEAKTNLSRLIDMVYHGEKVVIAKHSNIVCLKTVQLGYYFAF